MDYNKEKVPMPTFEQCQEELNNKINNEERRKSQRIKIEPTEYNIEYLRNQNEFLLFKLKEKENSSMLNYFMECVFKLKTEKYNLEEKVKELNEIIETIGNKK